ncbi:MAG: PilN domain-containing protein [Burkholderiales bacterium]|nr:PilN domain-containing protein [Burkholderiales bacterium]
MSQQINLFNPVFLKQKKIFSAATLLQAAALVLLGSGLVATYASLQSAGLSKDERTVVAQLHAAVTQAARLRAEALAPPRNKALEEELAKTEADVKSRLQIGAILQSSDFGNTEGYSAYLVAFARQIPQNLWLTGFSIGGAGNEIALQGRTLKPELLPLYVSRLKREPVMQGKSFSMLQMQAPAPDSAEQGKPGAARPGLSPPYLEFNLSSSGMPAGAAGGKDK